MTIGDLIKKLKSFDPKLPVKIMFHRSDGCDTCGFGHTTHEEDIRITDLETRIVLDER